VTSRIVEVNEEGDLHLSSDVLEHVRPHTRYQVNKRGDAIVLEPIDAPSPFWATASPQERAEDLMRWAESHTDGPGLPDEALRREHLYD
jgi:hypothetical protein